MGPRAIDIHQQEDKMKKPANAGFFIFAMTYRGSLVL